MNEGGNLVLKESGVFFYPFTFLIFLQKMISEDIKSYIDTELKKLEVKLTETITKAFKDNDSISEIVWSEDGKIFYINLIILY